ncbi:MAG: transglutaminase domain-containing protein, partial [Thermosynechococcaceae cyanobacterium]
AQTRELYFPTQEIALDPEGGLRSPGPLEEGLTYSVVSDVPYRDRTRLNQAATTYPKSIRNFYLQVPDAIAPQVRQTAERLLAKANRPIDNPYETALYLTQALKQNYTLRDDIPPLAPGQDLVATFLSEWKGGYADHFASVLTVMLRSVGIPARLATGFGSGSFNPFTGLYEVQNTDAFALTEVYFPGNGWFTFDAIPGHELYPPSVEVDQTFTVLRQFWNWVAGWLPSPVAGFLSGVLEAIGTLLAQLIGLVSNGWMGLLTLFLLTCGGSIGLWGLWQGWQAWRTFTQLQKLPPMERLYRQMLAFLAEQGLQKHPAETPLEYVRQVRLAYPPTQADLVAELSQAYLLWRYGNSTPDLPYLQARWQLLKRSSPLVNLNNN